MPDTFIFADEAGCFTLNREQNVSRYFIVCTVTMKTCDVASDLLNLRRSLAWEGCQLKDYFHAAEDLQVIRNRVFETILKHDFTVQATIMEKSKAMKELQDSRPEFYKVGYFFHFKNGISIPSSNTSETLVTTASLGTRKERTAFQNGVNDAMSKMAGVGEWKTDFMPCQSDPCLQVADYCAWAIQRKWERNDLKSYNLIKHRITYEYDLWQDCTKHYY